MQPPPPPALRPALDPTAPARASPPALASRAGFCRSRAPLHQRLLPACAPSPTLPSCPCRRPGSPYARSCELALQNPLECTVLAALLFPVLLLRLQLEFPNPTSLQIFCSPILLPRLQSPILARFVSATINLLRPPSSSSRQGRAGKGRVAPASLTANRSPSAVAAAPTVPAHGSTSAAVNLHDLTAAASPRIASLQATGLPEWWRSSSPMGSNEGVCLLDM